ncbi:MAG: hypothetical protein WC438_04815 [Candidatus Pacearchaeota archaeon]
MPDYYNAKEVVQRGINIISAGRGKKPPVKDNEILVGIMNNGVGVVAPDVTSDSRFKHFYDAYSRGDWLKMDVYALPKDEVENCSDQGIVPINDLTKIVEENPPKIESRF